MKRGFTLVELLIVMVILVVLAMIMIGILNPTALLGKGHDARRKKDLYRIRVAFEEYYNDRGCYPTNTSSGGLFDFDNYQCNSNFFSPWLTSMPCDPLGNRYLISVELVDCPKWYKLTTKLENLNDPDIPPGWSYDSSELLSQTANKQNSNYGLSSSNKVWSDTFNDPGCMKGDYYWEIANGVCRKLDSLSCNSTTYGPLGESGCKGNNCYVRHQSSGLCLPQCKVPCCGGGCSWP